jgi:hypothetical protein
MGRVREEMPVDEVEAVRTVSGEPPGCITIPRREYAKPVGNGWDKMLSVM